MVITCNELSVSKWDPMLWKILPVLAVECRHAFEVRLLLVLWSRSVDWELP